MSITELNLSIPAQRVLGTLAEKQRTVPDTYPLSLNALLAGCNQKTCRNPVLELDEAAISAALDELKDLGLVSEVSGSRVVRFAHHLEQALAVPTQAGALLTVFLLRGPQTAGELRLNCERLHAFADISSVEAFLVELAGRPAGALVVQLPRAPGSRESRWMHLLGGVVSEAVAAGGEQLRSSGNFAELSDRVAALEAEVAEVRALLARLTG
ncbi:YceH family protein [Dechloromonas sp.]|uniref:YceH family protein n=1 Tax=Dechloromonas sp. TaxID=1917218 RepID=UPI0011F5EA58|nr:YceH family protein [Dechloromonas sp.]MBU3695977.1 DUF480 domain-containing protein [Dechloromonas sp.]TEX47102.1 MAG: hypothetical protein CFR70_10890 [Rhodocyclaceae bacterium]